jgi:hypothetical protein
MLTTSFTIRYRDEGATPGEYETAASEHVGDSRKRLAVTLVNASRLRDTHRRSHARFLLRLVQQATEEMQWVSGSFHLQTKLRSQQPEPVLFDFRFAGLRR